MTLRISIFKVRLSVGDCWRSRFDTSWSRFTAHFASLYPCASSVKPRIGFELEGFKNSINLGV